MYFKTFFEELSKKMFSINLFNKIFIVFTMYSNNIFPTTDLPRGLGLNFFSLVLFNHYEKILKSIYVNIL